PGDLAAPVCERPDAEAPPEQKAVLQRMSAADLGLSELAGEPVARVLTSAPGDGQPIGGVKVMAEHGWFAARPSGTEAVYKLYAESWKGDAHLRPTHDEARAGIPRARQAAAPP